MLAATVVQGVEGQDRLRAISIGLVMVFREEKKKSRMGVCGLDLSVLGQRSVAVLRKRCGASGSREVWICRPDHL